MKTILYLDHTAKIGGGEIALLNLVTALDKTRFTPIVALASDGPLVEKLRAAGIQTHVLPLDPSLVETRKDSLGASSLLRLGRVTRLLGYTVRLARWARAHKADLIHTNSLKSDLYGAVAGRLARIPVLWHVRDHIASPYLPHPVAVAFRFLARCLPAQVIVISDSVRRCLQTRAGQPLKVIHDGCVPQDFDGADSPENDHAPVISLIGRIAEWKGQHVFLQAAAQVRPDFPQARFQIIGAPLFGEHDYEQSLHDLAAQLGLETSVQFLGFRDNVPHLLAHTDIVVHASTLGEPFGQVVIEGMAAGKPVIATDGGALPEIVQNGETGLLVPPAAPDALADAIRTLLADPARAHAMGLAGRKRVQAHFTIAHTCAKVQTLYDQLLPR